jgi:type I restriction enzyme S subunit
MKNSDVPWLGKVPQHWDVRRLKRLCSRSALYGANVPATEYKAGGVRFLRTTDITEEGRLKGHGVFLPRDVVREYILNDGDLLISRSGTIGRSFLYDRKQHGPCAYAGYLVRFVLTADAPPEYLFLFTKTQAFAGFLRVMAISSTIENVNGEKYGNCPLPLPPLPEQAAIVRFLDHADRRIRRYIRAKQKLIKLLEEQKQAIIHRAVTRGLDPNVRLKPSGVEWLGDVPEHWEVRRLKSLAQHVDQGVSPQAENALAEGGAWGVLKAGCVNRGVFIDCCINNVLSFWWRMGHATRGECRRARATPRSSHRVVEGRVHSG